ncbi:MAG: hypothetical protein R3A47_10610 [Polyangiales bacterium]
MATGSSGRPDPAQALQQLERPKANWKVIAQILVAMAVVWVIAAMMIPYIGYWGLGIAGVLTLVVIGFGVYIYRLTRQSADIVDILRSATDKQGREAAIEQLRARQSGAGKDALSKLAEAQLVAQQSPTEAIPEFWKVSNCKSAERRSRRFACKPCAPLSHARPLP